MKLSLDPKFLTTAAITFVMLVAIVAVLNKFAGPAAASVAGTVVGAIAIKLFDKLDYTPTFDVEFGAPTISAPWIYSAIAAVFLLYGCDLLADLALSGFKRIAAEGYECRLPFWIVVAPLDWGGYLLGGWVIGRLFSQRALVLSSIAAVIVIVAALIDPETIRDPERIRKLASCITGEPSTEVDVESAHAGFRIGAILGIASRAYLSIVMARLASRSRPQTATTVSAA